MTTGVHVWSKTASSNSSADSSINFAEGQAPSSVNDSARALMARTAEWRDDNAGTLVTAGSSTAFTVATNTVFTTLSLLNGVSLTVKFDETNGASPTLNVDGLGAKAIHTSTSTEVPAGLLLAGSIWKLTYDNSNSIFVLHGVPAAIGASTGDIKLTLKTSADIGWLMMADQTIGNTSSGATFADATAENLYMLLWNNISDTYAPVSGGRGSTAEDDWDAQKPIGLTKILGRALAAAGSGSGLTSRALGATAGAETVALSATHNGQHSHVATDSGHQHLDNANTATANGASGSGLVGTGVAIGVAFGGTAVQSGTANITVQDSGSGTPHANVQPTSFLNVMVKL